MQTVKSGWQLIWVISLLNLLLQWMFTIIIFNPATDKWMDTAPRDFCQGSCDPVDCMPIEKRILSIFLSVSERIGLPWTDKEDTQMLFRLLFFFNGEGKYLFSNLDSSLSIVWINMLFVIKSLVFLFVHTVSQANAADTTTNALNVPQVGEKEDKKKKKLNDACFFSQCQMWDYWTNSHCSKLITGW